MTPERLRSFFDRVSDAIDRHAEVRSWRLVGVGYRYTVLSAPAHIHFVSYADRSRDSDPGEHCAVVQIGDVSVSMRAPTMIGSRKSSGKRGSG